MWKIELCSDERLQCFKKLFDLIKGACPDDGVIKAECNSKGNNCTRCWEKAVDGEIKRRADEVVSMSAGCEAIRVDDAGFFISDIDVEGFPAGDAAGAGKGGAATYSGRPAYNFNVVGNDPFTAGKTPAVIIDGKMLAEGEYHER